MAAQPAANARLGLGMVGTGERGSALMQEILNLGGKQNVRVTALCDVWQVNLRQAAAQVKQGTGTEPHTCTRYGDLLARSDVDAVVIATPDFSHAPILLAALAAGKDVYVEKPMTIEIDSANRALDLARAQARVVQVGTQRRSEGRFLGAAKLLATGLLGRTNRVSAAMYFNEARWARPYENCHATDVDWEGYLLGLPKRPFDPRLLRRWQLYRETSNGLPGLWMTHYADAVHLLTGGRYPRRGVALGGIYVWPDGREHTDTFHALLEYPEGFLFDWGMGLGNGAGVHFTVHGTQGTLDVEKWTVSAAGGRGTPIATQAVAPEPTVSHMENWLACLRSRQRPNADIEFGHQHVVATVMAARALETGQRQQWEAARRELRAG